MKTTTGNDWARFVDVKRTLDALPAPVAAGLQHAAGTMRGVYHDFRRGGPSLRAMSLVYTTLLALVPFIAVCFSVLKGFGFHQQIEPALAAFLAPLGERGSDITARVVDFVDNVQVGVLGSAGLAFLFYTVLSLIQKVELAFNEIWQADAARPLAKRLPTYLSAVLIGPVAVVTILGMTATAIQSDPAQWLLELPAIGRLAALGSTALPYLVVVAGFALAYAWIPNTEVHLRAAAVGALFSGLAWETAGLGFATFVAGSARYDAIYSSFAILILFMIWTYMSWLILLAGANIAFRFQHPYTDAEAGATVPDWPGTRLALSVAGCIVDAFRHGPAPPSAQEIGRAVDGPSQAVDEVLERLVDAGVVLRTDASPAAYTLARPPQSISVSEMLAAIGFRPPAAPSEPTAGEAPSKAGVTLAQRIDRAIARELDDCTLADLDRPRQGIA